MTPSRRRKNHRRQLLISGLILIIVIGGWLIFKKSNSTLSTNKSSNNITASNSATIPGVMSGVLPWSLQNPISRLAVFPNPNNSSSVILAGGYNSQSNTSSNAIYSLNITNGSLNQLGQLAYSVHDMAYAQIGQNDAVFGGGTSNSITNTTLFNAQANITSSSSLPANRSDASAVTINKTTYIIGGYTGQTADSAILATTDGQHFSLLANLAIPVRYAAITSLNNLIYVFGGQPANNPNSQAINTVQIINPSTKKVSIASFSLPIPLEGAIAVTLNNNIYLAGGLSTKSETIIPGLGTTQIPGVAVSQQSLTQNTIWALNLKTNTFLKAGVLQLPVAFAGYTLVGNRAWIIGGEYNSNSVAQVQMFTPTYKFGIAGHAGAGLPYNDGSHLMIADRGNNRILVLNTAMQTIWKFPKNPNTSISGSSFYFPDDAFFANHGTEIISNQENNNTIVIIGYPSGKILWTFGHPLVAGSANGYLKAPDDAYLLKNNEIVVADDQNCRVQFISYLTHQVVSQIGQTGNCNHQIGQSLSYVNGDTPLMDGNILLSEIRGSYVDEYTPSGKLVWSTQLPISYPSDPQQLGATATSNPNRYLIADYSSPGAILQFTRQGQVLSRYQVSSGQGMLNYPSLVEMLPSGVYMANDDHNHRMVAIDPTTSALVWQYGITGQPGTAIGQLHKPDGFDLLLANNTTPTHLATK